MSVCARMATSGSISTSCKFLLVVDVQHYLKPIAQYSSHVPCSCVLDCCAMGLSLSSIFGALFSKQVVRILMLGLGVCAVQAGLGSLVTILVLRGARLAPVHNDDQRLDEQTFVSTAKGRASKRVCTRGVGSYCLLY